MEEPTTSPLPVGVVTFLFTDVEGSTRLIQQFGESFHAQFEEHNRLVRAVIESHHGTVVGTEGDSFFAVFQNPVDSLAAAAEIQRQLAGHEWPSDGEIKVRIGIHTGVGVHGGSDYIGIDVNRAARISAAGSGGQILVSDATAALVGSRLPESTELVDLGKHRLKDLSDPEALFQMTVIGLQHEFPALSTLDAVPNNLPLLLTSFVGRRDLVEEIADLLLQERIVTLTGPGGTGKTRLSLQVAADVSNEFRDGVFFVPLAAVTDPDLVSSEILDALGISLRNMNPDDQLQSDLEDKELLLVLDNFEQVLGASPLVGRTASSAPRCRFLTTSRAPLSIVGEQEKPIPSLATPTPDATPLTDLSDFESVHLFIDRAQMVVPSFELTAENGPYIARLVDQVDGLPLAIELLASRVKLLPPKELSERYEARTLSTSKRDLPERQRSVWGAIDWSYDLLSDSEKELFARLGVFSGGGRLEEIELICLGETDIDLLNELSTLVDHSLVRRVDDETGLRFTMLHVIREYALEKLHQSDIGEAIEASHAAIYLSLAEETAAKILGHDRKALFALLDREHDNLRAALSNRYAVGDSDAAMRLCFATWRFMQARGHLHEAKMRLDEVLAMSQEPTLSRAKALEAAGGVAWWRGDLGECEGLYRQAMEICLQQDNPAELANSLYNYGLAAGFGESLDVVQATDYLDRAQAIYESLGDAGGLGDVHWGKANLEANRGIARPDEVKRLLEQAAVFYQRAGNNFGLGWSNFELGETARRHGDFETAELRLRDGLRLFHDQGDLTGVILFMSALSAVALATDDLDRAHRLSGAFHTLRITTGSDLVIFAPNVVEGLEFERLEALVGDAAVPYREGREMSVAEAVAFALGDSAPQ